jgi:hypothetical protein
MIYPPIMLLVAETGGRQKALGSADGVTANPCI